MSELLPNTKILIKLFEYWTPDVQMTVTKYSDFRRALKAAKAQLEQFTTPDAWVITSIEADLKRMLNRLEGYKK